MAFNRIKEGLLRQAIQARNPGGKERLAVEIEVSASYLDKLLSGKSPGPKTLARLEKALGIHQDVLLEAIESPDEPQSA